MTQVNHIPAHVSRNGKRQIADQWVVNHPMFPNGLSFATREEAEIFASAMAFDEEAWDREAEEDGEDTRRWLDASDPAEIARREG